MASKSIQLQVRPRGKPIKSLPESVTVGASSSSSELYNILAKQSRKSIHQLKVTKGSDGSAISNSQAETVHATGLRDQSTIYVKDLGRQISWQTVFVIEYLGPVIFVPLIYFLRPYIYSNAPAEPTAAQTLVMWQVTLHFIKRELETLFVHRFSNATMPFFNVFKNSGHYWFLSGINLAAWVFAPSSPTAKSINPIWLYGGLGLWAVGELANFQVHIILRNLRRPGTTERNIPRGFLFNFVTCPNYMMETFSWIGVYLVSNFSWSVLLFTVVAFVQMAAWGKKKEMRYRREFGDKYKKHRYSTFPGIY